MFALMMFADGVAGALRVSGTKEALAYLGYPLYLATIIGIAKTLGAIAILQNSFPTIKEWAYAGFTFVLIGGFASHAFVGSGLGFLMIPIIILVIMFLSYFLWRKIETEEL